MAAIADGGQPDETDGRRRGNGFGSHRQKVTNWAASILATRIARQGTEGILYEDTLISGLDPELFELDPGPPVLGGGRGSTRRISRDGFQWILRHFYRGGLVSRVLTDEYLWLGEARTRGFREWRLLAYLHDLGLPVPRPVAARYRRRGLIYRADLITQSLPGVESFSKRLSQGTGGGEVGEPVWAAVGKCIAAFHEAGVFHADLNAHNLQMDPFNRVFLLDFDRGGVRTDRRPWRAANLARLHRSLTKLSREGVVSFAPRQWDWLLRAYRTGGSGR